MPVRSVPRHMRRKHSKTVQRAWKRGELVLGPIIDVPACSNCGFIKDVEEIQRKLYEVLALPADFFKDLPPPSTARMAAWEELARRENAYHIAECLARNNQNY